jgi:hypothetical protein
MWRIVSDREQFKCSASVQHRQKNLKKFKVRILGKNKTKEQGNGKEVE